MTDELKNRAKLFIGTVEQMEVENSAAIKSKESLERSIERIVNENNNNREALDIATHALEILRKVSDEAVGQAYAFLEQSLNSALEKMFTNTTRKIKIKESIRGNQYPQLEFILDVGNGRVRSIKSDSGHGIAQIVSLLSILSIIVITGSRRILVMDEILSGVSVHNRKIVNDILWCFVQIGFQFIVNEHGFIPENSHVYHLEMVGDVSNIKKDYIAKEGVYLQGKSDGSYDYEEKESHDEESEDGVNDYDNTEAADITRDVENTAGSNVLSI